jgi:c-di-GMP-related signal transduction protein
MPATKSLKISTAAAASVLDPNSLSGGLRYFARQPILDKRGHLHGYELLFRGGNQNVFTGEGDIATRTILDNSVMFGLEQMAEGLPIFVNCTLETLVDGHARVLPCELTVLEILETLNPTPELINACRTLREEGYKIALDDFTWSPEFAPLISLADFIKFDFTISTTDERAIMRDRVRKQEQQEQRAGKPIQFIAEKIETQADYEQALSEGFGLFQGYYFCRPVLMRGRQVPSNRIFHIKILEELNYNPMNLMRLCSLVKRDAALTYRVLRLVNSPLYGIRHEIQSIQSALIIIGEDMFRRVAILAITSEWNRNQPTEILRMAFIRAKFCELIAPIIDLNPTEQYIVGLLSLMPAMLRYSMDSLVAGMPLREELQQALLGDQNAERLLLSWIEHYEHCDWDQCDQLAHSLAQDPSVLCRGYEQAVLWAQTALSFGVD